MAWRGNTLRCDMSPECTAAITHLDKKGYVYCTEHGLDRRSVQPCRKLRAWELAMLKSGQPLASYTPGPKPKAAEPSNAERAARADHVLTAYGESVGYSRREVVREAETVVGDLLCDLLHMLADTNTDPKKVFALLVDRATGHFEREIADDEPKAARR